MKDVTKVQFGNTLILCEGFKIADGEMLLRRPVICQQTKNGLAMTRSFQNAEDEVLSIWDAPGPIYVQTISSSNDLYNKYKELTSSIHLATAMPGKEN